MGCPDEHRVLDLIEGRLAPTLADGVERHLNECAGCSRLIAEYAALAGDDANPPLRPGDRIGRYEIARVIGGGAMGQVYAARDPDLERLVALKLVRDPDGEPDAVRAQQDRLLREAQAMAQLSHPNVVAVHEVGVLGDRVYLTMELVVGETLAEWLATERTTHEILAVFIQAGRGLAAAHAAGLVHRDVKPVNVLVGFDGRVRVGDFGLARAEGVASAPASSVAIDRPITQTGTVLGTPLYMAPERFRAAAADARSDQFSFCVALYEALYKRRPFAGATIRELTAEVLAGRIQPLPSPRATPARVDRAVARGLSVSPEDRHPSMDELLAALADPTELAGEPARRLRRAGIAALAGAAIASAVAWSAGSAGEVRCEGGELFARRAWGIERRAVLRAALGDGDFAKAAALIDRRAGTLASTHEAACRATRVTGEQSDAVLGLRMACLERQRDELGAAIEVVSRPGVPALDVLYALAPTSDCDGARVLSARVEQPEPAIAQRVEELSGDLARAKALADAGRNREARAAATAVATAATTVGYPPLEASARLRLGRIEMKMHDATAAEQSLVRALFIATSHNLRESAADATFALGILTGIELGRVDEAGRWYLQGLALAHRLGGDKWLGDADHLAGLLAREARRFADSAQAFRSAASRYQAVLGPNDPMVAQMTTLAGAMLAEVGELDRAQAAHEKAIAIIEAAYGADHASLAIPLANLARLYGHRKQPAKGLELIERAIALETAANSTGFGLAVYYTIAGGILGAVDDMSRARAYYERALELVQKTRGRNHPEAISAAGNIAATYAAQGRLDEAERGFQQALQMGEQAFGPDSLRLLSTLKNLGQLSRLKRRFADARGYNQRSLEIRENTGGAAAGAELVPLLRELATTELQSGNRRAAIPYLKRAIAIGETHKLSDYERHKLQELDRAAR